MIPEHYNLPYFHSIWPTNRGKHLLFPAVRFEALEFNVTGKRQESKKSNHIKLKKKKKEENVALEKGNKIYLKTKGRKHRFTFIQDIDPNNSKHSGKQRICWIT